MAQDTTQTLLEGTNETCPAVGYQAASICVPITVKPFAQTGTTITRCCGAPIVRSGKQACSGTKNGTCDFTIGQNIIVAIPVAFGAEASVGDTYVDCIEASAEEIDCDTIAKLGTEISDVAKVEVQAAPFAPAAPAAV